MIIITATLDGKRIAYAESTLFEVQLGHGKSSYRTVATYYGELARAVIHFNGINVHSGYKKRLYAPSMNRPTITRVMT